MLWKIKTNCYTAYLTFGNSIFLIGYMFNDDKLQYE